MTNKPTNSSKAPMRQVHTQMSYAGPLPLATELDAYERTCPGAADRIIAMAENQSKHRQDIEKITVKTNARNSTIGVIIGGLIGISAIFGGVYIITSGYQISGYATMLTPLAGLVGVFIYGKRSNKEELIEKQKLMNMVQKKQNK